MFEVIICTVSTGRVVRKLFGTRAEADCHIAQWEKRILSGRYGRSLRHYRVEVQLREEPRLEPVCQPLPAAA